MMIVNIVCCHQGQLHFGGQRESRSELFGIVAPVMAAGGKIAGAAKYLPILACRRIEVRVIIE